MNGVTSPVGNISDTARWVAVYRAMETERPDALFRDPFARELAGERGEEIVRKLRDARSSSWAFVVRTSRSTSCCSGCVASPASTRC